MNSLKQPVATGLSRWSGIGCALGSAVLFGASTPLAKNLLQTGLAPQLLAGLLYLGSGLGLSALLLLRRLLRHESGEASLQLAHLPTLTLTVLLGGVLGPVLLMLGLARTSAATAALLLNLEGLATMAIAWLVFRENVDRRLIVGAVALLAGALLLSWGGPLRARSVSVGALLIAGACVAWGADNNFTRKLSQLDPMQIAAVKGVVAGGVNLALASLVHAEWPTAPTVGLAGVIGFLGYGVSLVLFVLGLRHLGAARTAAYFSTAPFIGALLALVWLHESPTPRLLEAGLLMGFGLYLHLRERHEHWHVHETLEHEHAHTHDEHHRHAHGALDPPREPHSHRHRHEPLEHSHAHYPDLHHRHGHS
jgi:drug/metabolite transporter (DMT)-like permease